MNKETDMLLQHSLCGGHEQYHSGGGLGEPGMVQGWVVKCPKINTPSDHADK